MTGDGYSGWTNYPTWCVALWIDNDRDLSDEIRAAAEIWILENQAGRRNLSISQKAILALELEERYGDKKKANLRLSQGPGIKGVRESRTPLDVGKKSRDEAAEKFGIKGYAVGFAKTVQSRGVPELFDAVKSGSATITAADKVSRLSPEVQRSVVKGGPELVKKTSTVIHDLTNAEKITPGITEKAVSKIVLGEATTPKEAVEKAASAEELRKLREFNAWAEPRAREAGEKMSSILAGR